MPDALGSVYLVCVAFRAALGLSAQGVIYHMPGALAAMAQAILTNIEHVEHRHMVLLMKQVVEPMVLYCPPSQYASLVPFLAPFLSHTLQRLTTAWAHVAKGSSPLVNGVPVGNMPFGADQYVPPPPAAWSACGGVVVSAVSAVPAVCNGQPAAPSVAVGCSL